MSQTGKNWYVLKAVSGKELKVKEYIEAELKHNELLSQYVSRVLVPTEKHTIQRAGKRILKEKVSLPGYVFVEAEMKGDVAHDLRFMPNVLGFLGGLDNPSPVKQSDINRMLGNAEDKELFQRFLGHHRRGEQREAQTEGDGQDLRTENSARTQFYAGFKRVILGYAGSCSFIKSIINK